MTAILSAALLLFPAALAKDSSAPKSLPAPAEGAQVMGLHPRDSGCAWQITTLDTNKVAVLASWKEACPEDGSFEAAWSAAGDRMIWFTPWGEGEKAGIRLADVKTGGMKRLPEPPEGVLVGVAFGKKGKPMAFTLSDGEPVGDKDHPTALRFADMQLPILTQFEGQTVLAHAWRWTGDAWLRVETTVTDSGWDNAAEQQRLKAWQEQSSLQSADWIWDHYGKATPDAKAYARLQAGLDALAPNRAAAENGHWTVVSDKVGTVAWWGDEAEGYQIPLGPVVLVYEGSSFLIPVAHEEWSPLIAMEGPSVLISDGGRGAMVYDVRTGKLVWSDPAFLQPTFYPLPEKKHK